MSIEALETFFEHHGIKGQKWGVRKKNPSGPGTTSSSKNAHLTNDELRKLVDRMRLDQQFDEMSAPKKSSGKKFVSELIKDSGKQHLNKLIGAGLALGGTASVSVIKKAMAKG